MWEGLLGKSFTRTLIVMKIDSSITFFSKVPNFDGLRRVNEASGDKFERTSNGMCAQSIPLDSNNMNDFVQIIIQKLLRLGQVDQAPRSF